MARVREVFGEGGRADWSHVFRPAVEDEGQSHVGRGVENIVVEALRDILLGWTEVDATAAKPFVEGLRRCDNEMLRRVSIHVLNERWESLGDLYLPLVRPELFSVGHLHELYRLLNPFEPASRSERTTTISCATSIPDGDEEGPGRVEPAVPLAQCDFSYRMHPR